MMKRALPYTLALMFMFGAIGATVTPTPAEAGPREFCAGFEAGFKAAFTSRNMIPQITPICPIAPIGRDTWEGGFEIGMLTALARM